MNRRRPRSRLLLSVLLYQLLGAIAALALGWSLAGLTDPRAGTVTTSQAFDDDSDWTVEVARRAGSVCVVSSHTARAWSPRQATGAPDSPSAGDQQTAWATQQQDADGEWLELAYAKPVVPKAVHIYENDAPGAVCWVTVYAPDGREVDAWQGKDPTPVGTAGIAVSKIPLAADFPVGRVRIYLDSKGVPGWNEIDAVGLEDRAGQVQWATRAKASSWYGGGTPDPVALAVARSLVPAWSEPGRPDQAFGTAQAQNDDRVAVAYGWPVPAVWGERAVSPPPPPAPAQMYYPPPPPGGGGAILPSSNLPTLSVPTGYVTGRTVTGSALMGGTVTYLGGVPPASSPVSLATAPLPAPRRVLWAGLLVDAVVLGAMLAAARWLMVRPRRWVREVSRVRLGRCVACGYDLGYDFIHGCPECGWRRAGGVESPAGSNGRAGVPAGMSPGPFDGSAAVSAVGDAGAASIRG